jgi:hypothetical protein
MKLKFFQQILKKSSNIKFNENPAGMSKVVPRRWMDRHDNPK